MLIPILIGLVAVVVVLLVVVTMQPAQFRITRSTLMAAPPAVFAQVNDFHKWEAWSPWAKMDPNARNTFDGASSGEGAMFAWVGNNKVGSGKMTIIESRPSELIRIQLEFLKPFKATNTAEYTFKPEGNQTVMTWAMFGKNNFMGKAINLVMDCDKMVGGQFEKGLANIKLIAEAEAKK